MSATLMPLGVFIFSFCTLLASTRGLCKDFAEFKKDTIGLYNSVCDYSSCISESETESRSNVGTLNAEDNK